MHDWTRVPAGIFHDFHFVWLAEMHRVLNELLPSGYYALAEQVAGGPEPDVLTLEAETPLDSNGGGLAVATKNVLLATTSPPVVRHTIEDEALIYAAKADHLAIRHVSGDRVVAFVELVSPGNKHSSATTKRLIDKLSDALNRGCHLLLIDPHPPSKHDPEGLHAAFWGGESPAVTTEEPLSVSAYRAGPRPTAYFEPFAVGKPIPAMPLFLTSDHYISVPLETTYLAAWQDVPPRWKRVIEVD